MWEINRVEEQENTFWLIDFHYIMAWNPLAAFRNQTSTSQTILKIKNYLQSLNIFGKFHHSIPVIKLFGKTWCSNWGTILNIFGVM